MEQIKKTKRTAIIIWAVFIVLNIVRYTPLIDGNSGGTDAALIVLTLLILASIITSIVYAVKLAKLLNRSAAIWGVLTFFFLYVTLPILFFLKEKEKPSLDSDAYQVESQEADLQLSPEELNAKVVNMVLKGSRGQEVSAYLLQIGIPEENVKPIMNYAEDEIREKLKKRGSNNIIFGLLWTIGGVIATAVSMSGDSGVGYFFWGAILFGFIQFIQGIVQSAKGNKYKIS